MAGRPWRVLALSFVVVASVAGACGSAESGPPTSLGEAVYQKHCATCHGVAGVGGLGPALDNGSMIVRYPNPADHRAVVADGRNVMPAFGTVLSPAEIDAVVTYERGL